MTEEVYLRTILDLEDFEYPDTARVTIEIKQ